MLILGAFDWVRVSENWWKSQGTQLFGTFCRFQLHNSLWYIHGVHDLLMSLSTYIYKLVILRATSFKALGSTIIFFGPIYLLSSICSSEFSWVCFVGFAIVILWIYITFITFIKYLLSRRKYWIWRNAILFYRLRKNSV